MAFKHEFHEFFDKYVANPYVEMASRLGGLAIALKVFLEGVQVLAAYPEIEASDVLGLVGWGAGALAVGSLSIGASQHYRGLNHVPPRLARLYQEGSPACMLWHFGRNPRVVAPGQYVCGAQSVEGSIPCGRVVDVAPTVRAGSRLHEAPSSPSCFVEQGTPIQPPEQPTSTQ